MFDKEIKENLANGQESDNDAVNQGLVNQLNLLQRTLGNQEVQKLVQGGTLINKKPTVLDDSIIKDEEKKAAAEELQKDKDLKALKPIIDEKVEALQSRAKELKQVNPESDIFVNVTIDLNYVEVPGDNPVEFYHYTKLVNVDLSNFEKNKVSFDQQVLRGKIETVTYSFLYDKEIEEDNNNIQSEDNFAEEIAVEEESFVDEVKDDLIEANNDVE